jgi:hypothetical protein
MGKKTIEPWERQAKETDRAYTAFKMFRDQEAPRSTRAVSDRLESSYPAVLRWRNKHSWVNRCIEYDRYLDRKRIAAEVNEIELAKKRQREIATGFFDIVRSELPKLLKASEKSEEVVLSPEQLKTLAEFAARLERLNLDEPTENLTVNQTSKRKKLQELFMNKGAQGALDLLATSIEE